MKSDKDAILQTWHGVLDVDTWARFYNEVRKDMNNTHMSYIKYSESAKAWQKYSTWASHLTFAGALSASVLTGVSLYPSSSKVSKYCSLTSLVLSFGASVVSKIFLDPVIVTATFESNKSAIQYQQLYSDISSFYNTHMLDLVKGPTHIRDQHKAFQLKKSDADKESMRLEPSHRYYLLAKSRVQGNPPHWWSRFSETSRNEWTTSHKKREWEIAKRDAEKLVTAVKELITPQS
jgi:hypothetical protein